MKLIKLFHLGLSLLIVGCSSTPSATNYYLLNNQPSKLNAISENITVKEKVIVVKVKELPEYLEQPHLVMQMADHQLHYANFHMWAEPLKKGFTKALLADLSKQNSMSEFIAYDRDMNQDKLTKLVLSIDFFHASANSEVLLAGQYWMSSSDKNKQFKKQFFSFALTLEKNGYPHSIEKMRRLVSKLAEKIAAGI